MRDLNPPAWGLIEAIRNSNLQAARQAIEAGADVNAVIDDRGNTALHYAAAYGNGPGSYSPYVTPYFNINPVSTYLVQLLLDNGADANIANTSGHIPLLLMCNALRKSDVPRTRGTRPTWFDDATERALLSLIRRTEDRHITRLEQELLENVAPWCSVQVLNDLIAKGVNPNMDDDGITPLWLACRDNSQEAVLCLIQHTDDELIDMMGINSEFTTPLVKAAGRLNMIEGVKRLVARGVSTNAVGGGETPLWHACSRGIKDTALFLIEYTNLSRELINTRMSQDRTTLLHEAMKSMISEARFREDRIHEVAELVAQLLIKGADPFLVTDRVTVDFSFYASRQIIDQVDELRSTQSTRALLLLALSGRIAMEIAEDRVLIQIKRRNEHGAIVNADDVAPVILPNLAPLLPEISIINQVVNDARILLSDEADTEAKRASEARIKALLRRNSEGLERPVLLAYNAARTAIVSFMAAKGDGMEDAYYHTLINAAIEEGCSTEVKDSIAQGLMYGARPMQLSKILSAEDPLIAVMDIALGRVEREGDRGIPDGITKTNLTILHLAALHPGAAEVVVETLRGWELAPDITAVQTQRNAEAVVDYLKLLSRASEGREGVAVEDGAAPGAQAIHEAPLENAQVMRRIAENLAFLPPEVELDKLSTAEMIELGIGVGTFLENPADEVNKARLRNLLIRASKGGFSIEVLMQSITLSKEQSDRWTMRCEAIDAENPKQATANTERLMEIQRRYDKLEARVNLRAEELRDAVAPNPEVAQPQGAGAAGPAQGHNV